ncbi:unnamed protein product, partial [Mesorhabditis spiculigera]
MKYTISSADKEYSLSVAPNKLAVDTASPWVSVVRERYTMCATGHCSYTRYMQMWEAVAQNHLRALMLGNYIPGSWNHYWVPNGMAMHMLYVTLAKKHQPFAHLKLRFSNVMRAAFNAGATARIGLASRDLESLTIDELEEMTTARGTVYRATAVFDTLMLGFRSADGEQTWMKYYHSGYLKFQVTPLTRLALYADALDEGLVGETWIEYPAQHPNHWRLYDTVLNEERPEVQPLLVQMLLDWNAKRSDPEPFERLMVNWLMQYGRLDEAYKAITEELKQPENIAEISTGLPQKAEYPLFLIRLSCYFDQRRCIDWAKAMFDADVKKHCQKQQKFSECTKLRPFIRPFVYCVVVTAGSQEDVDMITWARENEVDRTEQQNLIDAFRRECIKPKTPENDPYFRKRTGIRGIFAPFSIEKDDVYE